MNTSGEVVVAHRESHNDELYYRIGKLQKNSGIVWNNSGFFKYDVGYVPTISIDDEHRAIELHEFEGHLCESKVMKPIGIN